ncbi:hypothetical protein [Hymenobacter sp. DG01]|uniref:hypothetical protein n=1 Tax=Hymenobacter sp. DG01 TaxID=2584940 RepID=UPI001122A426|nr:hypothetical protein [Hymenobacter sp. DG01]
MATLLPSPTDAALILQQDRSMLERTREQARSAAFLATMLANSEQSRLLSRALEAVSEPVDLATQVYLIGRLYTHVAAVYQNSAGAARMQLEHGGPPAPQVFKERGEFLYQVSQLLTVTPAAAHA